MASPHVAGIVALMAQKNPATCRKCRTYLETSAIALAPGCRTVLGPAALLKLSVGSRRKRCGVNRRCRFVCNSVMLILLHR